MRTVRARMSGPGVGAGRMVYAAFLFFRRRTLLAAPKVSGLMTPAIRKIPVTAQEAPSGERMPGRVPQPVLLRQNTAPTFKPEMR